MTVGAISVVAAHGSSSSSAASVDPTQVLAYFVLVLAVVAMVMIGSGRAERRAVALCDHREASRFAALASFLGIPVLVGGALLPVVAPGVAAPVAIVALCVAYRYARRGHRSETA